MGKKHGTHGDKLPDVGEILVVQREKELEEGEDGDVHVPHQVAAPVQQVVEDGVALFPASLKKRLPLTGN